jgi:hypothetical protein
MHGRPLLGKGHSTMRRWQIAQHGLKGLFLVAWIVVSCSAPSDNGEGGGCGGSEASITCVNVVSVIPTSVVSGDTSNVDARQDVCTDLTGAVSGIEPFADHNALVTFQSQPFPTVTATGRNFSVRIVGYSVAYRLNRCPTAASGCPPLAGFTVSGESIFIPAGGVVSVTLPFVPLSTKDEYVRAGGELGLATPSYSVTYTFTGQTVGLNDTFTVQGSSQFTITDFNLCGR